MANEFISRNDAATHFVTDLYREAYLGGLEIVQKIVDEGPSGGQPPSEDVELHEWFKRLDLASRARLTEIMKRTAFACLFCCCVLIDGAAGRGPLSDEESDYPIYLASYPDEDALASNRPSRSVRINPAFHSEEDLHDIFKVMVEDLGS